jgi:hypothetical protein
MDLAIDKFDSRRFGLITGSACDVLFPDKGNGESGKKSYAKKLANQKYFRHYDEVSTWQMQHGNLNEHEAFTYYQDNYDFDIQKGHFAMDGDWAGTSDALGNTYGMDLKCPCSLEKWLDYIHIGIDRQQFNQCQMYMFLFEKESWKICAYLTETEWMVERELTYPVPADKRMITVEVAKDETWEARLRLNTPFVVEEREKFYKTLCDQFGDPQPELFKTELITA